MTGVRALFSTADAHPQLAATTCRLTTSGAESRHHLHAQLPHDADVASNNQILTLKTTNLNMCVAGRDPFETI
jgi:hypothetical protein